MTAPAEGPATVTLTDDEHNAFCIHYRIADGSMWLEAEAAEAAVERIVAARVAALTADLAAANAHAALNRDVHRYNADLAAARERVLMDELNAMTRDHDLWRQHALAADQVIANVRALADDLHEEAQAYTNPTSTAIVAKSVLTSTRRRIMLLLPAAPTGEGS
jgi:hypothetical protein